MFASSASAAINPKFLKSAQERAGEQLVLKVSDVTVDKKTRSWRVEATGVVKEVKRSESGLKAGATIRLRYTSKRPPERGGWTGPRPTPVVSKGLVGAYLWGPDKEGYYGPAARSYSFVSPKKLRGTPKPKPPVKKKGPAKKK
jgi:hypothetical protein